MFSALNINPRGSKKLRLQYTHFDDQCRTVQIARSEYLEPFKFHLLTGWVVMKQGLVRAWVLHELEYHYSDGAFGDGSIRYYGKTDWFAIYKLADISNFTVLVISLNKTKHLLVVPNLPNSFRFHQLLCVFLHSYFSTERHILVIILRNNLIYLLFLWDPQYISIHQFKFQNSADKAVSWFEGGGLVWNGLVTLMVYRFIKKSKI